MVDQLPTSGGRVIENPISGERIVIRTSSQQSDGRLLSFELYLPAGRAVPAAHAHPEQVERFTLLDGQLRFRLGQLRRRTVVLTRPGQTVTIPAGMVHWFSNPGEGVAHARVDVEPALRMEELLAASEARAAGKRLVALALLLVDFQREIAAPGLPRSLVVPVLAPIARLARRQSPPRAAAADWPHLPGR